VVFVAAASPTEPAARAVTPGRVAAVAVVLALALLWIYVLAQRPERVAGTLDDPAFAAAAQPICLETVQRLAALPPAFEVPDGAARADVVEAADAELAAMLDRLEAIAPTEGRDAAMVREWLDDWRIHLGDRADYARRVREDGTARFYVTAKDRDQITDPIDHFAEVNRMPACATPGDLG
jgi:hypothetical protein